MKNLRWTVALVLLTGLVGCYADAVDPCTDRRHWHEQALTTAVGDTVLLVSTCGPVRIGG